MKREMRRILLMLTVAALMVVLVAINATSALAQDFDWDGGPPDAGFETPADPPSDRECVPIHPSPRFPWGGLDCSGSQAGDWPEPVLTDPRPA